MFKRLPVLLALVAILVLPFPSSRAEEPVNLSISKAAVQFYVDSGRYDRDVTTVALSATEYLTKRLSQDDPGGKRAVVFDIDETALSNLPHLVAQDYGYEAAVWNQWVLSAQAKAISSVRAVYDLAIRHHVAVFFITGRGESQRAATERNLRTAGYETWTKVYCKPEGATSTPLTAVSYKTGVRRQLSEDGYVIIANLGDQDSDLLGGYAEKTFKIPNPFYLLK